VSELHNVNEADVPLTALNAANVVAVKLGQLRQLFLRDLTA
jgi:hypothetical protein